MADALPPLPAPTSPSPAPSPAPSPSLPPSPTEQAVAGELQPAATATAQAIEQDATKPSTSAHTGAVASCDKTSAALGESVRCTVTVTHPKSSEPVGPEEVTLEGFEVSSLEKGKRVEASDNVATDFTLTLAPFDTEVTFVQPVRFTFGGGEAKGEEVFSPRVALSVKSALEGDNAQPADVASPVPVEVEDWRPVYAIGGALIVALIALAMWLSRKYGAGGEAKKGPPPPPLAPHVVARAELKRIRDAGYLARGEIGEFYVATSGCVRTYFGRLLHIDAAEMTTEEFFAAAAGKSLPGLRMVELRGFLEHADIVKFSTYRPTLEQCADLMSQAEGFVLATEASAVRLHGIEMQAYETKYGLRAVEGSSAGGETEANRALS